MIVRRMGLAGLLLAVCLVMSGCAFVFIPLLAPDGSVEIAQAESAEYGEWVVVFYEAGEESGLDLMDALLETELDADEALDRADIGMIEGNEVGGGTLNGIGGDTYELYFIGTDADRMWEILQPVLDRAPIAWERVELRDSLGDPRPTVIRR